MSRLGISIYPQHASIDEVINYIELAAKYGYERIFTCLISANEDSIQKFKTMIDCANKNGMNVISDINPEVVKKLGLSIYDLGFFKNLGLAGIRLDMGFSGEEEAQMTYNKYGLKIELNMSMGTRYVENIMSYKPNIKNLYGCHNFYPRVYTGLSYDHFIEGSKQFKKLGLNTAAFVNSTNATTGPWPVSEGLCTLEEHRNMPIDVQAKQLFATGLIDDVIIANAFASEEELKALSEVNREMLEFAVELVDGILELQREVILDNIHFNRGDVSEYVIRSTEGRFGKYKGKNFIPFNTPDIKRGDITIDTDLYTRYAGEVQIALKDMKNSGKTNVVGKISEDELFLLDYIEAWTKFKFKLK